MTYHRFLAWKPCVARPRGIALSSLVIALLCVATAPLEAADLFRVDAVTNAPSAPFAANESTNNFITLLRDVGG